MPATFPFTYRRRDTQIRRGYAQMRKQGLLQEMFVQPLGSLSLFSMQFLLPAVSGLPAR